MNRFTLFQAYQKIADARDRIVTLVDFLYYNDTPDEAVEEAEQALVCIERVVGLLGGEEES